MTDIVAFDRVSETLVIAIDNPPVNAIGPQSRGALARALQVANQEKLSAIALYCRGRTFCAGADIRALGVATDAPSLPELVNMIETSDIPVVCALHGTALGGGLEIAMACHLRVATPDAKVGLPENLLGIPPGAGGTQRLPRLAGIPAALDIILSGRKVAAPEALDLGIIDQISDLPPRDAALAAVDALQSGALVARKTGDIAVAPNPEAIQAARDTAKRKSAHLLSPHECIDCIDASTLPIAEGMAIERAAFVTCMDSPQKAGLTHAFMTERAAPKGLGKTGTARALATVGVVGGGTMGIGIATSLVLGGKSVILFDPSQDARTSAQAAIRKNLDGAEKRGKIAAGQASALTDRLDLANDLNGMAPCDLVIEAVFEDMAVKHQVFGDLSKICRADTILASNTSYLNIDDIASVVAHPDRFLGLHFFSPAHVMKLLEVVIGAQTSDDALATAAALAKSLGKVAVPSGVCDGFIGNRINAFARRGAEYMMQDGASPYDIDAALESFGFAMGPFKVGDLAGLDIAWANRKRLAATRPASERYVDIADRICEQGWFGRKTGAGYYRYDGAKPVPNPDVNPMIYASRAQAGITARSFDRDEILSRHMMAMIVEGLRALQDGIARKPVDIDAVFLFGFGFPRHRGGPMHHADQIGLPTVLETLETYAADDPVYWDCPKLLKQLVAEGRSLSDLNKD